MSSGAAGVSVYNTWRYQGYLAHGGSFKRSVGLRPEGGYVDLSVEDVGALKIKAGPAWFEVGGSNAAGPKDIRAWFRQRQSRPTVTSGGVGPSPGARGGLLRLGNLFMSCTGGADTPPPMSYSGVMVADGGTEELRRGHAAAREHRVGLLRVQLTDVRSVYDKFGAVFGRINCRLPQSGNWDRTTTKDKKDTPWSAIDVFEFLFSELPGFVAIHKSSAIYSAGFADEPPTDLQFEGELARDCCQQMLDRYGLVAQLLPDNRHAIFPATGGGWKPGEYAPDVDAVATVPETFYKDESRAVSLNPNRAHAVLAVGKRRVRAITIPLVPVLQNPESGKVVRLNKANVARLGYTLDKLNKEVLAGGEKNFRDVEPKKRRLGTQRATMFKEWAYKVYAPAMLFGDGATTEIELDEDNIESFPFLPMLDAQWRVEDLKKHGEYKKKKKPGSGPLGEWVLNDPVVFAARHGQGMFKDFDAVSDYFKMVEASRSTTTDYVKGKVDELSQRIKEAGNDLRAAETAGEKVYEKGKATGKFKSTTNVEMAVDINRFRQEFKANPVNMSIFRDMDDEAAALAAQLPRMQSELSFWKAELKAAAGSLTKWKESFKNFQKIFFAYEGVPVWMNLPHGPVPGGSYSLDLKTGFVKFPNGAYHTEEAFLFQREGGTVLTDGLVFVTYGYELRNNLMSDFTSVGFVSKDNPDADITDGSGVPGSWVACAMNRGLGLKPRVEKVANMRLYENENGIPYNLTEVVTEAASRAAGALSTPRGAVGYTVVMQGSHKASLDEGISSVQHDFDGVSGKATTTILVNALGGRGPMGPPRIGGAGRDGADRRDDIGRAEE